MALRDQKILPALKNMKDFEYLLGSSYEYIVLLDSHIGNLKPIIKAANQANKKVLVHVDLIQGLKNNDYGTDFLCHEIKPAGLISTRGNVILKAREKGLIAIQRLFLLDSGALNKSYEILSNTKPNYIEVLPGIMPGIIREVYERTRIPILAGGLIRSKEDVESAMQAGVEGITTSNKDLWFHYENCQSIEYSKR